MGGDRDKRFAIDDEKRRERERKALRLLAELELHEDEAGRGTLIGFDQMSGAVGAPGHTRVEDAFSALPWSRPTHATFDEFRATGLREVLARVNDRTLRNATLAAADHDIATRVATTRPAPSTAIGTAMWRAAERRAATLYRHAQDSGEVATDDPVVDEALARCGSGQPLPASVRAQMERELGISLARVRVHTDAIAAAAAKAVRAHAFTVGEDIFFADGTYAPDSREGRKLLAHELTHVVQAQQGRTSTGGSGVRVSEPGEALEREADAVAERMMQAPRAPKRNAPSRAGSKARYAPAPSRPTSMLLRKAAATKAPVADGTPFKEIADRKNKTTWRLGDDDVFVCVSGPDGKPLDTTVAVSAERNPDRWNALGKAWAAAAPRRTWPRPPGGRSTAPKASSARMDSTPPPSEPPAPDAGTPTPRGTVMDIGAALEKARTLEALPDDLLGIPVEGTNLVYFDFDTTTGLTITAPTLRLSGIFANKLTATRATLSGLVIRGTSKGGTVTFSSATLDRSFVVVGGKEIGIRNITLIGGSVGAVKAASWGAGIHFAEARITGIRYPGAPPADLVVTHSSLLAVADSLADAKAMLPSGGGGGDLPTLPKLPLLAGTRVSVKLAGIRGAASATSGTAQGGFSHFEAQLLKDGTPEPLASITIDGAKVSRNAYALTGTIDRVRVTGSADFVLALLDSPTIRAQKDVADVIDQLTKVGIVPTAGTQLTLEHVHLGAAGSRAAVRTDIVLDFDVPGSLKLHVELRGASMSGDVTAQTGHVDFGKVLLVLSDGKGPIAALMAEGNADKTDKKVSGAIRHLQGTGDVSRITAALRSVKLPPKVDAVLATVKKHVSADTGLDVDMAVTTGADGKDEIRGNAQARLELAGIGSIDLKVVNFHSGGSKTLNTASLGFDRFEAHLTPSASTKRKATGDVAAIVITGANAAGTGTSAAMHPDQLQRRATATMIDARGDLGKAAKMVTEIHSKVATLPPMLQQAVQLVHTLDLGVVRAKPSASTPAPASAPLPKTMVSTNAHVALAIPRVGTLDATVRGFVGWNSNASIDGDFETFEVALLTPTGKRAARIVIRGGGGSFEPATKNDSAAVQAQLQDVALEGNTRGLLQALESHPALLASAPTSIRTGFEYLRAHHEALDSTANARVTNLAAYRSGDQFEVATGAITAQIKIPGGTATATLTGARVSSNDAEFALLEVKINDNAAILRIRNGQWTTQDATGTAQSIRFAGDGSKLLAMLEPSILGLLPLEIATSIRKYNEAIVSATATNVSVKLTDDGAVAKLPFLDLNGSITFTDRGKTFTCKHASIHVYGAHVDGSADSQTITADRARVEGEFEQVGGRTMRGKLVVTTGAATLTHGDAGSGLVAKDIRANGWLDVGAGKGPEPGHELKEFEDTVKTATTNAPAVRWLELDIHAPLTAGTYGTKQGLSGKAMRVRVSPGAALHLRVEVNDGMVSALVANIDGDVSAVFGNKFHRLAVENQVLDVNATGWLGPLIRTFDGLASKPAIDYFEVKFDVAGFVSWAADQYRPFIVEDLIDKDPEMWADEGRREREAKKADLDKRKAEHDADPNHDPADEPKPYGALMKDWNLSTISGTLSARIARPEAVGFTGADELSGDALIHGSLAGGKVRLDADAAVNIGRGTAEAKGMSSGDLTIGDGVAGGTKVSFDNFHVEQLSWDPTAAVKTKTPPK